MRICIVAENASTRFGGEAILPVHYFRILRSRGIEAWLVVHERTRRELEEIFPNDRERILFVPDLWIHKLLFRLSSYLPSKISEVTLGLMIQGVTQMVQRKIVRRLVRTASIDVIHQPIPVAPRFPSAMFGLGAPIVVGPLNGGMQYPAAFRGGESWISRAAIGTGRLLADAVNIVIPGKTRADVVIVANERTRRALPFGVRGKVVEMPENGVDLDVWSEAGDSAENNAARFVFLGRLVDWKAVDIAIRAIGKVKAAQLDIIGDGPMLQNWKALVNELGVESHVQFLGWMPQHECAARIRTATALVLPSLYECGGAVVLEAMAMKKAVIATKWGGPADYLDASCGFLIEPTSYDAMVDQVAEAMQTLIQSPGLAKSMGEIGYERIVSDFDWQRKIDKVICIYTELSEKFNLLRKFERSHVSPKPAPEQQ
jgi:glycosyltransferase involved in cell wall biosynthesis